MPRKAAVEHCYEPIVYGGAGKATAQKQQNALPPTKAPENQLAVESVPGKIDAKLSKTVAKEPPKNVDKTEKDLERGKESIPQKGKDAKSSEMNEGRLKQQQMIQEYRNNQHEKYFNHVNGKNVKKSNHKPSNFKKPSELSPDKKPKWSKLTIAVTVFLIILLICCVAIVIYLSIQLSKKENSNPPKAAKRTTAQLNHSSNSTSKSQHSIRVKRSIFSCSLPDSNSMVEYQVKERDVECFCDHIKQKLGYSTYYADNRCIFMPDLVSRRFQDAVKLCQKVYGSRLLFEVNSFGMKRLADYLIRNSTNNDLRRELFEGRMKMQNNYRPIQIWSGLVSSKMLKKAMWSKVYCIKSNNLLFVQENVKLDESINGYPFLCSPNKNLDWAFKENQHLTQFGIKRYANQSYCQPKVNGCGNRTACAEAYQRFLNADLFQEYNVNQSFTDGDVAVFVKQVDDNEVAVTICEPWLTKEKSRAELTEFEY